MNYSINPLVEEIRRTQPLLALMIEHTWLIDDNLALNVLQTNGVVSDQVVHVGQLGLEEQEKGVAYLRKYLHITD